jgi:hypothetical protein
MWGQRKQQKMLMKKQPGGGGPCCSSKHGEVAAALEGELWPRGFSKLACSREAGATSLSGCLGGGVMGGFDEEAACMKRPLLRQQAR